MRSCDGRAWGFVRLAGWILLHQWCTQELRWESVLLPRWNFHAVHRVVRLLQHRRRFQHTDWSIAVRGGCKLLLLRVSQQNKPHAVTSPPLAGGVLLLERREARMRRQRVLLPRADVVASHCVHRILLQRWHLQHPQWASCLPGTRLTRTSSYYLLPTTGECLYCRQATTAWPV